MILKLWQMIPLLKVGKSYGNLLAIMRLEIYMKDIFVAKILRLGIVKQGKKNHFRLKQSLKNEPVPSVLLKSLNQPISSLDLVLHSYKQNFLDLSLDLQDELNIAHIFPSSYIA